MKFAPFALVSAALIAAPAAAHAGGYVTVGIGPRAHVAGTLENSFTSEGHSAGRVGVGTSFGPVSVEVALGGYGLTATRGGGQPLDADAVSVSASVKGKMPLLPWLDGFGRVGLQRTWVSTDDPMPTVSGDGYLLGLGVEAGLPFYKRASAWLEINREVTDLSGGGLTYDGVSDTIMIGIKFGL